MYVPSAKTALLGVAFLSLGTAAPPASATLISMTASGTISENSSADNTIAVGTPWAFELIYDTDAPDLDFELTGTPTPDFGRYTNTGAVPALTFFHYQAGSYAVTIDDPADFGPNSDIDITFGAVDAIDINLNAPDLFPPLAGGAVSFHADFNDFSGSSLTSDALPTNTELDLSDFPGGSTVTLLPISGGVVSGAPSALTFADVPEPSACVLASFGLLTLLVAKLWRGPSRAGFIPVGMPMRLQPTSWEGPVGG